MGCSAPVSRRVPGSVMSMASALSAASLGPAPSAASSSPSTTAFSALKRRPSAFFASGGAAFSQRPETSFEPPLLAPQPLQPKGLHGRLAVERGGGLARLALQRGKRLVQRGLVKCRQIRYRFVVMRKEQDKPLREAGDGARLCP